MINAHKAERTGVILGDAVFTGNELNLHSPYYIPAHISEPNSDAFAWVFDSPESASKSRAGLFLRNARDLQALESSDLSPAFVVVDAEESQRDVLLNSIKESGYRVVVVVPAAERSTAVGAGIMAVVVDRGGAALNRPEVS